MKKYFQPKVKALKLDDKQAVMSVCKIGGMFFNAGSTHCQYGAGGPAYTCPQTVKGVADIWGAIGYAYESFSKPS
ncbi:MAG: hypothetical protein PHQ52_01365 [Candidatus Omnitrophica bacterium]|nr:hypothetical protein [Candidatus Omnitrophota bacterium]